MKNRRLMLATVFLAVAWAAIMAEPNSAAARPHVPLGSNPYPVIWGGQQARSIQPAPRPPAGRSGDRGGHDGYRRHNSGRSYHYVPSVSYRSVGGFWGYNAYGYGYPYVCPYASPLWLSTEGFFGPPVVRQFGDGNDGLLLPRDRADVPEPKKAVGRATNAESIARARRFIGFGDAQFAQQKYSAANERYRKAAQSDPQLADAWFRQAFALSAIGRYKQAVAAIQRGLKIDPNWAASGFDLKQLYGFDQLAKEAHLDALAQAAENSPNNADLLFLVGVHLHFDGQSQRAEKFFQRAKELAGDDSAHIQAFMKKQRF